ncbi:MAG: hypothetical protein JSV90_06375 [Methanobacteriota archaeon]|nr:MAG: hypothetical protein JSV90_06375 [Euryarchaeota archaeon]
MVECEFPECTTFGSVIRFALELEKGAAAVYQELADNPGLSQAAESFRVLSAAHKKREELLEHTRREKLNEMILEPIHEIDSSEYIIETKVPEGVDLKGAAEFASDIEAKSARFYSDSSKVAQSLLAEAARILDRMGKENQANKEKLEAL